MKTSTLVREQLQQSIDRLNSSNFTNKPLKGWIKSIRSALGMSERQLADKLSLSQARIAVLEKSEIHGNLTLKSLREAANALDCKLVYALIPNSTLEQTMKQQALKIASKNLSSTQHTMSLENQRLSAKEIKKQFDREVNELVTNTPRWFWDKE